MLLIQNVPTEQPKMALPSRTESPKSRSRVSGRRPPNKDTQRVSRVFTSGAPAAAYGFEAGAEGATEGVSTVAGADGAASGAEGATEAGIDGTTVTVGGDSG